MKHLIKTMAFTLLGLVLSSNLWAADSGLQPSSGKFIIDFYDSEKLTITNGTGLSSSNYASFVKVAEGLTNTNVVTGVTTSGTVQYGKNGGLTIGSSSANSSSVSFTIGSDYAVNKVTVYATKYEDGRWLLNANAAGSGSLGSKGTAFANVTSPLVWDNLNGITTLAFTKDNGSGSNQKRLTIYTIVCEYTSDTPSGPTLESIYFTDDAATKLSYTEGDVFDPAGLVVMGKYSEGEDKPVTDDVEWSFSPETLATTTTSVTVTAHIDDVDDVQKIVNGITVASVPKFTKVTANKTDWSGEYLLVYENNSTAYVWTGVDAGQCHADASISNNQIAKPADATTLTIAAMTGGYSIQVNGGTNDGKYIKGTSGSNVTGFESSAQLNTISFSDGNFTITSNTSVMRYNKDNGVSNERFRYYKSSSTSYPLVQLYEKVLDPISSAVTFTAPEGGSLVIKNGATPINSGTTIQDGTVLDVEFGMTPAEAYKDVAIKVTKTEGGDDVTSTVYNSETQKITMPRYPITVAVTFTKLYKISLVTDGTGTGTATMNGVTTDIYVDGDTQIDLVASAVAPNEFTKWSATENITIDKENDAETYAYAFGDGTITATFGVSALLPLDAPTLSAPTNITYNSVTLNWQELANAEGGYNVEILLNDETVAFDLGYGENYWTSDPILQANTTYTYTVQGVGDGSTYAEENNPKATSTFTTADYPAATLTLSENGETSELVGKLNTPIELPTTSTQACDGKVFVGWSENPIEGEVGKDQVSLLDATYTFTDPSVLEKTIYAVYAKKVEGDKYFEKVSSAPSDWCGKYLIVYEADKLAMDGSLATLDAVSNTKAVTISDSKIAWSAEMEAITFTVAYKTGSSTVYSLKSASGKYISGTTTSAAASNGLKQADTDVDYEISFNDLTIESKSSDQQMVLKYNKSSGQTRFRFYKSGQEDIAMYKYSATIDYSNYCTICQAAVAAPTFSLEGGNYSEAKTLTLTATEGDIYYTINGGTETLYEEAIVLDNRGTFEISAYAKVDDRTSETVTKTYTLNWPYTLDELAASDVADGTTVQVTFENKEITNFYTNSQGKRYGIYVNVQKGGKDVEIYCNKAEHSDSWEVGGKVSSTQAISGTWTYYSGGQQWEFCPNNWDNISYTAPAKIESLEITGDVTNKNYTAGQQLDFTGLTVTGVYSDATEEDVTEDVVWTEVILTENQPEATATATLNNAKTGNIAVSQSKSITGLTVGAKVELSKIEITTEASKKDFFVGRNFNHDGIVVTATYTNATTSNVTNACDFSTPSLSEAGEETITITYSEGEGAEKVETQTSYKINVTYMNLSDLVAEDIPTNTSVKVAFSDVEITGFYKNSSDKRAGVYVNVIGKNGSNIELYSGGTPSETLNGWQEGGKLASKGDYITGTWKYYDGGSVWEIDFGNAYAWATNIEYTAPEIYPTEIELNETTAKVKQSKSLDLEASFTPTNATVLNNLEWSSDNNQVTVAPSQDKKSAKVTVAPDATAGNTATITVKVDDKDGNELSATCVITIQEYSVPRYGLYSGDITGGDYIFKADGKYYFMNNTISSSRLTNVANADDPNIVNNVITTDAEAYVWHIAKSGDYWTIQNLANNKYAAGTGSKNQAQLLDACTDNMAKWTITYDEENEVYTFENFGRSQASSDKENKYLRNNDNSGWACYQSGTGNAITLYKAGFTPAAALQSIEIKGELGQTEYFIGKSVKYDGLTVEGTYSDGDKKTITEGIVWSAYPATFTEIGDNISVTITATVQTKSGEVTDDAEFTVKVIESQQVSYGLVTSVNTLYDGATIILGAVFGTAAAPIYAVNQGFDTKYLAAYRSNTEGSDLKYEDEVMKTAYASEITLKKVEGGWKLLGEDGKYINGAGDLSQTTDVAEATVWTISIEDGVAKIASGSNIIYYNTSSPRFKTYTNALQEIGIYMKNLLPIRKDLTIGQYTTYCEPYAVVAGSYSGATFWNITEKTYMSDNQRLYSITIEQHLGDLKAGVPYIMLPEATQLTGVQYGEAIANPVEEGNNGLYGTFVDYAFDENETVARDAQQLYVISNGTLYLCGTGCGVYANRAYIKSNMINYVAPSGAPRRTIGRPNDTQTTLNGLFGNQAGKAQKALIDGHIYILRDNKMYNAQGLFVK